MLFTSLLWDRAFILPRIVNPVAPSRTDCDVWTIFLSAATLHLPVTC